MADDLAARADALAASDRVRRQLLADVSHELTTPVTAMRGYLETLTMPELTLDEATRARYLTIISDETARLERLIGDLLDLARLEGGGGIAADRERAGRRALRPRRRRATSARCEEAGVTLADVDRAGRAKRSAAIAIGSSRRCRTSPPTRCATRRAAARCRLAAVARRTERRRCRSRTKAPGIAPEHLPHIFDRFYKADAARAGVTGGSGLGLSIVKAIVERHGGTMTGDQPPGRTVFEMVLPMLAARAGRRPAALRGCDRAVRRRTCPAARRSGRASATVADLLAQPVAPAAAGGRRTPAIRLPTA